MFYFVKTPGWLRRLYKECLWSIPGNEKKIYLTFDDGPHPTITPFVLDQLKTFNAKATFFCIGKNVMAYPDVYKNIINEGHVVGNHSFSHLNGWKTSNIKYQNDVKLACDHIDSNLFRPPYGRIKRSQLQQLENPPFNMTTIMWTVLSADFDETISGKRCLQNVLKYSMPGAIIVFHDSEKANERLRYTLPEVLHYYSKEGYEFEGICVSSLK
ncbi:MAG: polysaccharide deacetylase family protein [Ferruginibacter sp.]